MPVRTSSSEPHARDPATLTVRPAQASPDKESTRSSHSSALRDSVLNAYAELGVLDQNSYIADWIFNDTALTVEELEASYRTRVRFQNHDVSQTTPPANAIDDLATTDEGHHNWPAFLKALNLKKLKKEKELAGGAGRTKPKKENRPPDGIPASPAKKGAETSDTDDEGYLSSTSTKRRSKRFFHLKRKSRSSTSQDLPRDQAKAVPKVASDAADGNGETIPSKSQDTETKLTEPSPDEAADGPHPAVPPSSFSHSDKPRRRWSLLGSLTRHQRSHSKTRTGSTVSDDNTMSQSAEHGQEPSNPASTSGHTSDPPQPFPSTNLAVDDDEGHQDAPRVDSPQGDANWETMSKSDALSMDLLAAHNIEAAQNHPRSASLFSKGKRRLSLQ